MKMEKLLAVRISGAKLSGVVCFCHSHFTFAEAAVNSPCSAEIHSAYVEGIEGHKVIFRESRGYTRNIITIEFSEANGNTVKIFYSEVVFVDFVVFGRILSAARRSEAVVAAGTADCLLLYKIRQVYSAV